jgi:hypothetical protein
MKIDGIFNIKSNSEEKTEDSTYYGLIGEEDFLDDKGNPRISSEDNPKVMAKAIPNKPSKHMTSKARMELRFYIKTKQNDVIFNPVQLASNVKDRETFGFINNTCKGGVQFREVPQSVFDKYVTFLKTKNIRWLNAAQRELK